MAENATGSVSAVVPSLNGLELLRRSLPALVTALGAANVCVVDDAGSDGTIDMLRREFPEVRAIARETNGGFSVAVNQGIRAADADLIVLLNNDVEVSAGFLDPILPLFDDETVFAASPRILLPTRGNIDEGCKTGYWHRGVFYTSQKQGVSQVSPVLYSNGCASVCRRSMLAELGGFDEAYSPFYWEDTDLGYRAWKRGWKSLYQPGSTVVHQHSASISRFDPARTRRTQLRNAFMFVWRNIDDPTLIRSHRRWLPVVLARKAAERDWAWVLGWSEAFSRRRECVAARIQDSKTRRLTDAEILGLCTGS